MILRFLVFPLFCQTSAYIFHFNLFYLFLLSQSLQVLENLLVLVFTGKLAGTKPSKMPNDNCIYMFQGLVS